jgi:hypothetical protein
LFVSYWRCYLGNHGENYCTDCLPLYTSFSQWWDDVGGGVFALWNLRLSLGRQLLALILYWFY